MSENNPFGFAKLVPGFDFLQNLATGASQNLPHMPSLSSWVAPTSVRGSRAVSVM